MSRERRKMGEDAQRAAATADDANKRAIARREREAAEKRMEEARKRRPHLNRKRDQAEDAKMAAETTPSDAELANYRNKWRKYDADKAIEELDASALPMIPRYADGGLVRGQGKARKTKGCTVY